MIHGLWLNLLIAIFAAASANPAGDRAGLLFTPQESLRARYDVIRRAQKEIILSTFSINPDEAGLALLQELANKARAGVRVRILMDGVSHGRDRGKITDVLAHLERSGVEIREYVSQTPSAKLQRAAGLSGFGAEKLHAKILIGDGVALSGGRNLNNQGLKGSFAGAHDVDAIFAGPSVAVAKNYLEELGGAAETRPLHFPEGGPSAERGEKILAQASAWMSDAGIIDPKAPGDLNKLLRPVKAVRFLHDRVATEKGSSATSRALQSLFGGAESEVLVSNHTANITDGFWKAFADAHARGAKVNLVTNAPDRYPGGTKEGRWHEYVRSYDKFAANGMTLSEFKDRASLHAKVATVDGKYSVVSSFNLEPASEYLNQETALVIDDEATTAKLRAYIQRQEAIAQTVVKDGAVVGTAKKPRGIDCGTAFRLLNLSRGFR